MAEKKRSPWSMIADSLASLMTGGGTSADRRTSYGWMMPTEVSAHEIEAAYRGSWLMRKIIDLPASDMTRAWRDWQATAQQIELLEAEERRLGVREKVTQALILGRLGGGALIMGIGNDDPATEASPEIGKGGLSYLFVTSRYQLTLGPLIEDMADPNFGEPEYFKLKTTANPQGIEIHRSRVIPFKGRFTGRISKLGDTYWGDSEVIAIDGAVKNAEIVCNEIASLIPESKIDLLRIPDLMRNAANPDYKNRFMRRLDLAAQGKSNHRMLVVDKDEEWEQRELSIAGFSDIIRMYLAISAGAADIPATRLLGKAPDGMNATGEGDQSNYDQMIVTKQENELRPRMDPLDQVLVRSALGSFPPEVYYEWSPLTVLSETAASEVDSKDATTLKTLVETGLFQDEALERAYSNRMIESGRWPGYDDARDEALAAAENEPDETDVEGVTSPAPQPSRTGEGAGGGNT